MFDYTSTSRIRRKVRSQLTKIRNKVQEEVTVTLNEFSAVEGENFQQKIKRMMHRKSDNESITSTGDSSSSDSDEEVGERKSFKQRFVLSI